MRIVIAALLLLAFVCGAAQMKEQGPVRALKFTDFPATGSFHGKPAPPILTTKSQRMFRTAIREAAAKGLNFAGHYTIAEWGCGSGCMSIVVIDALTGKVFAAPFRILSMPLAESEGGHEYQGAVYQLNSRLLIADGCPLIADGCPEETNCGTYYYEWSDNKFKRLRFDPARSK
jgi:hypothetical protein